MVKGSFSKKLEETLIPIGNKISSQKMKAQEMQ